MHKDTLKNVIDRQKWNSKNVQITQRKAGKTKINEIIIIIKDKPEDNWRLSLNIIIIKLNVNSLNIPIKNRWAKWIKNITNYMLYTSISIQI